MFKSGRFAPGELALLLDPEEKPFLVRLSELDALHHHRGAVRHADVIGQPEGARIRSSQGRFFTALRPRLLDYVLHMPRRSGIVYPKDAAHLIAWADIAPGHRVLESGIGSGALTIALLRALGGVGELIVYEQRADFIELATRNVQDFDGPVSNLLVRERTSTRAWSTPIWIGSCWTCPSRGVSCRTSARRWRVAASVAAYTPSIIQASQLVDAMREAGEYVQIETHEVLLRGWHIRGAAVRPEHEMVGHTGFVTVARFVSRTAAV